MSSPNAKRSYSPWDRLLIRVHQRTSHRRRITRLIEALGPRVPEGARVLDLGCGDMTLAAGLAEACRLDECVGADIWPMQVEPPAGCRYVQVQPGQPLPWPDQSFDVVLLIDVLHHAADPAQLLAEALRAGKRVLIKDHLQHGPWSRLLLRLMDYVGNHAYGVPTPARYFTRDSFAALLRRVAPGLRCRVDVGLALYDHLPLLGRLLPPELHFIAELEAAPENARAVAAEACAGLV